MRVVRVRVRHWCASDGSITCSQEQPHIAAVRIVADQPSDLRIRERLIRLRLPCHQAAGGHAFIKGVLALPSAERQEQDEIAQPMVDDATELQCTNRSNPWLRDNHVEPEWVPE